MDYVVADGCSTSSFVYRSVGTEKSRFDGPRLKITRSTIVAPRLTPIITDVSKQQHSFITNPQIAPLNLTIPKSNASLRRAFYDNYHRNSQDDINVRKNARAALFTNKSHSHSLTHLVERNNLINSYDTLKHTLNTSSSNRRVSQTYFFADSRESLQSPTLVQAIDAKKTLTFSQASLLEKQPLEDDYIFNSQPLNNGCAKVNVRYASNEQKDYAQRVNISVENLISSDILGSAENNNNLRERSMSLGNVRTTSTQVNVRYSIDGKPSREFTKKVTLEDEDEMKENVHCKRRPSKSPKKSAGVKVNYSMDKRPSQEFVQKVNIPEQNSHDSSNSAQEVNVNFTLNGRPNENFIEKVNIPEDIVTENQQQTQHPEESTEDQQQEFKDDCAHSSTPVRPTSSQKRNNTSIDDLAQACFVDSKKRKLFEEETKPNESETIVSDILDLILYVHNPSETKNSPREDTQETQECHDYSTVEEMIDLQNALEQAKIEEAYAHEGQESSDECNPAKLHSESAESKGSVVNEQLTLMVNNLDKNVSISKTTLNELPKELVSSTYNLDPFSFSIYYSLTSSSEMLDEPTDNNNKTSLRESPDPEAVAAKDEDEKSVHDEVSEFQWDENGFASSNEDNSSDESSNVVDNVTSSNEQENLNDSAAGSDILELPASTVHEIRETSGETFSEDISQSTNQLLNEINSSQFSNSDTTDKSREEEQETSSLPCFVQAIIFDLVTNAIGDGAMGTSHVSSTQDVNETDSSIINNNVVASSTMISDYGQTRSAEHTDSEDSKPEQQTGDEFIVVDEIIHHIIDKLEQKSEEGTGTTFSTTSSSSAGVSHVKKSKESANIVLKSQNCIFVGDSTEAIQENSSEVDSIKEEEQQHVGIINLPEIKIEMCGEEREEDVDCDRVQEEFTDYTTQSEENNNQVFFSVVGAENGSKCESSQMIHGQSEIVLYNNNNDNEESNDCSNLQKSFSCSCIAHDCESARGKYNLMLINNHHDFSSPADEENEGNDEDVLLFACLEHRSSMSESAINNWAKDESTDKPQASFRADIESAVIEERSTESSDTKSVSKPDLDNDCISDLPQEKQVEPKENDLDIDLSEVSFLNDTTPDIANFARVIINESSYFNSEHDDDCENPLSTFVSEYDSEEVSHASNLEAQAEDECWENNTHLTSTEQASDIYDSSHNEQLQSSVKVVIEDSTEGSFHDDSKEEENAAGESMAEQLSSESDNYAENDVTSDSSSGDDKFDSKTGSKFMLIEFEGENLDSDQNCDSLKTDGDEQSFFQFEEVDVIPDLSTKNNVTSPKILEKIKWELPTISEEHSDNQDHAKRPNSSTSRVSEDNEDLKNASSEYHSCRDEGNSTVFHSLQNTATTCDSNQEETRTSFKREAEGSENDSKDANFDLTYSISNVSSDDHSCDESVYSADVSNNVNDTNGSVDVGKVDFSFAKVESPDSTCNFADISGSTVHSVEMPKKSARKRWKTSETSDAMAIENLKLSDSGENLPRIVESEDMEIELFGDKLMVNEVSYETDEFLEVERAVNDNHQENKTVALTTYDDTTLCKIIANISFSEDEK